MSIGLADLEASLDYLLREHGPAAQTLRTPEPSDYERHDSLVSSSCLDPEAAMQFAQRRAAAIVATCASGAITELPLLAAFRVIAAHAWNDAAAIVANTRRSG